MSFIKSSIETNLYTTLWGKGSEEARWLGSGHVPNYRYNGKLRVLTDYVSFDGGFSPDSVILGPPFPDDGCIISVGARMRVTSDIVSGLKISLFSSNNQSSGERISSLLNFLSNDYNGKSSTSLFSYVLFERGNTIAIENVGAYQLLDGELAYSVVYCL